MKTRLLCTMGVLCICLSSVGCNNTVSGTHDKDDVFRQTSVNHDVVDGESKIPDATATTNSYSNDEFMNTLRKIYVMPTPSIDFKDSHDAIITAKDFSNLDLRGLYLDVDFYTEGVIYYASFENSDLTGFTTSDQTEFDRSSFQSAILRDTFLGYAGSHDNNFTDAVIHGSSTVSPRGFLEISGSKNYKKKDLSGTIIPAGGISYESFDLSYSCIVADRQLRRDEYYTNYIDADITGAVVMGVPSTGSSDLERTFPHLSQTQNYKETNLGSVVFVNLNLEDTDLSGQTLGYFDSCDLRQVNLHDAYFHAKDERTIMPFSRVIPAGFTDSEISIEQFRTTRNYKIWIETGIPEITKIRITPNNARFYNFEIIDGNVRPKDHPSWEPLSVKDIFVFKVGNIHVTEEIANILETEREQQMKK